MGFVKGFKFAQNAKHKIFRVKKTPPHSTKIIFKQSLNVHCYKYKQKTNDIDQLCIVLI